MVVLPAWLIFNSNGRTTSGTAVTVSVKNYQASATALVLSGILLQGCAGSAPDYSPRTAAVAQEATLSKFFDQEEAPERTQTIVAPVCSSTVGASRTGWTIDGGNWCIVACDKDAVGEDRWLNDSAGNRCLATADRQPTSLVSVQYSRSDLSLNQPALFTGFSRSFLSDTEWSCVEYRYRVDPETNKAFWDRLAEADFVYRFHRSGKLAIGPTAATARPSGNWSVGADDHVYFNTRRVFTNAIDYGGGRFDDFITSDRKQVCRYVREADLPGQS
jgi:hypothetical protein